MNKKLYIGLLCVIFIIVLYIYWYYIKHNYYKKIIPKTRTIQGI